MIIFVENSIFEGSHTLSFIPSTLLQPAISLVDGEGHHVSSSNNSPSQRWLPCQSEIRLQALFSGERGLKHLHNMVLEHQALMFVHKRNKHKHMNILNDCLFWVPSTHKVQETAHDCCECARPTIPHGPGHTCGKGDNTRPETRTKPPQACNNGHSVNWN